MEKFYKTIKEFNLPKWLIWIFVSVFVLVIIGGVFVWISAIGSFYEKYQTKVQWPVIIRIPLVVTARVGSTLPADIDKFIEEEINSRLTGTPTPKVIKAAIKLSMNLVKPVEAASNKYCYDVISCIRDVGESMRFSNREIMTMIRIAKYESGYDPTAGNKISTASGVFQILNGTWSGNKCTGNKWNYVDNIKCAYKIYKSCGFDQWEVCTNGLANCY